jgi:hypothetical protein
VDAKSKDENGPDYIVLVNLGKFVIYFFPGLLKLQLSPRIFGRLSRLYITNPICMTECVTLSVRGKKQLKFYKVAALSTVLCGSES